MSGRFWLISLLAFLAVFLVGMKVVLPWLAQRELSEGGEDWKGLVVGQVELVVLVADSPSDMERGLSGRDPLSETQGMLFIYPYEVVPRFWMKEMRFDLDMVWIRDGEVVEITENVPAPTNDDETLPLYSPSVPVDMVLEVRAGWVARNQVTVGMKVEPKGWQIQK